MCFLARMFAAFVEDYSRESMGTSHLWRNIEDDLMFCDRIGFFLKSLRTSFSLLTQRSGDKIKEIKEK